MLKTPTFWRKVATSQCVTEARVRSENSGNASGTTVAKNCSLTAFTSLRHECNDPRAGTRSDRDVNIPLRSWDVDRPPDMAMSNSQVGEPSDPSALLRHSQIEGCENAAWQSTLGTRRVVWSSSADAFPTTSPVLVHPVVGAVGPEQPAAVWVCLRGWHSIGLLSEGDAEPCSAGR